MVRLLSRRADHCDRRAEAKLEIGGEDEFVGRGVLETGQTERELLRNKRVMIVGGGDAAPENALP
jgi:thioredoxin reductase